MEYFWYIVLVAMLAVYVVLDGYDFGAGIIHLFFAKTEELASYLQDHTIKDSLVLVKGSRGMKLESVIEFL